MGEVRITLAVLAVLQVFLEDSTRPRYGYELMGETSFPSGKLYPILARLHSAGWLIRESEDVTAAEVGRPVRRLYRLSAEGLGAARAALAEVDRQLHSVPGSLRPQMGPA